MRPASSRAGSSAVDKVLAVLAALAESERISDIAVTTGLPKSTVHRILQTCVAHGFARVTESGTYVGGPTMLGLAGRLLARDDVVDRATPALRELQSSTGATVHFALLAGDEAVYAAKVEPARPYRMASRVGMTLPLHSTAIGKASLAAMSEEEVRTLLGRTGMPARTANTFTDVDRLLAHLSQVRQCGWAVDDQENEMGVHCVAAAVCDHTARVVGAVSVSVLASEPLSPQQVGPKVGRTARAVSAALGELRRAAG